MWKTGSGEREGGRAREEEEKLIRKLLHFGWEIMATWVAMFVLEEVQSVYVRMSFEGKGDYAC